MKVIKSQSHNGEQVVTLSTDEAMLTATAHNDDTKFIDPSLIQYDISVSLLVNDNGCMEANSWRFSEFQNANCEDVAKEMKRTSDWAWENEELLNDFFGWMFDVKFASENAANDMQEYYGADVFGF